MYIYVIDVVCPLPLIQPKCQNAWNLAGCRLHYSTQTRDLWLHLWQYTLWGGQRLVYLAMDMAFLSEISVKY